MERYENVIVIALLTASNVLKICSVVALCYAHTHVNREMPNQRQRSQKTVKNMKRLKQPKGKHLRYTTGI